ncbi:acyl-CoA dehydrogenase family protein [Truepera radiovictrix]|uniref:Acyl-CoA dehydrogenase domain protein n=1 Tax=Truepera radiovictrix (strain DSM 17093 / CIP 108686 / LMG 22925 / RQ-24) TaxID=649638 RepID=D7CSL4_TRURR|nr:acyl-CoA dehydrogenase family protein [Truepera radiovictrix]ADI15434.1 acyl-CoA dehydrogenase domain protein [Truepera radiovictrix DSM 17093]WMT56016.1 acyl-CoA dehydrogenase family protein [Truepera radiovictrix]
MEFALSEDLLMMQRTVRDFAQKEIAPIAAELDRYPRFPWPTLRKMGELGLLGMTTPECYGGLGLGTLDYVVMLEEISAADASHGTIMSVTSGLPQTMLVHYGTEAQKARYLPKLASGEWIGAFCLSEPHAGSDAAAITTRARKVEGGYVLSGTKAWITSGGEAQVYLVMAKTDPSAGPRGVSCFVVDKGTPGMHFGKPEEKLGQHAATTTSVIFEDCFVPDGALVGPKGQGLVIALESLDGGRIGIAAQAVGIARAALEAALAYAGERRTFGKPIREHQGVAFKLADMATRVDAARLLTQRAAWLKDHGYRVTQEASMAKLFASETASFVTHAALQVLGGYGYSKDYPVERYFRDARVTEIYEGTSEIQRIVIARQLYREA